MTYYDLAHCPRCRQVVGCRQKCLVLRVLGVVFAWHARCLGTGVGVS